jgi:ATP-binding cassette subfamily B protein
LHKLNEEIDNIATKYFGLKKRAPVVKEKDGSNFNLHIDNLVIRKREKIAIVGKNGNGKTTFVQLLLNIYQPTSGDIILFGNNLKNLSQESITANFSSLYQDYSQQSLKTHEYIALSEKNEINMDRIRSSAKMATADEFIEKWDDQYTQQLGVYMKGVKPSKGQWQKLALARTFYKDSPIIVLDEPTASIDATSSKKIFENLKNIDKEKTLIIVSHNMTDIAKFVDRIIVFDKGRIVGDGPHKELLKTCPVYKDLYESENR